MFPRRAPTPVQCYRCTDVCKAGVATVRIMSEAKGGGITKTGKKKTVGFHEDEAEGLRRASYEQRRPESEIIREAVRRFLNIED